MMYGRNFALRCACLQQGIASPGNVACNQKHYTDSNHVPIAVSVCGLYQQMHVTSDAKHTLYGTYQTYYVLAGCLQQRRQAASAFHGPLIWKMKVSLSLRSGNNLALSKRLQGAWQGATADRRASGIFAGVLPPLLRLQQLDWHDIEGIGPLFAQLCGESQPQSGASMRHSHGVQKSEQHPCSSCSLSGPLHTAQPFQSRHQKIPSSQNPQQRQPPAAPISHFPVSPFQAAQSAAAQISAFLPAASCDHDAQPLEGSMPNTTSVMACVPASVTDPDGRLPVQGRSNADQVQRGADLTQDQLLQLPETEACAAVRDYLIAAAAKDCSLMLCMQRMTPARSCMAAASDMTCEDLVQASPGVAGRAGSASPEMLPKQDCQAAVRHHADDGALSTSYPRAALADATGPTEDTGVCPGDGKFGQIQQTPEEGRTGLAPGESLTTLPAGNATDFQAAAEIANCLNHSRPTNAAPLLGGVHGCLDGNNGTRFGYALVIIDLDRKAASKIPKHYALDAEIMQHACELQNLYR